MLWTATMLLVEMVDQRTIFRDYWIEWGLAALLLLLAETAERWIAVIMGAAVPLITIVPPLLISIFTFPIAAWLVGRLDHWRLGR
jgi:rod shape-determining protein MreD